MNGQITQKKIDAAEYRKVVGRFVTGVTVLATDRLEGGYIGMTASSFTSVSLEPTLILVCVGQNATFLKHLKAADYFSVNILAADQQALSPYFAGQTEALPSFSFIPWVGGPRLEGAHAALACRKGEMIKAGDHWIVLGEVLDLAKANSPDSAPLTYYQGKYFDIVPRQAAQNSADVS